MSDQSPQHPPTESGELGAKPEPRYEGPARTAGRCDQCGYSLIGLPTYGVCPECGEQYSDASAMRLKPWPSALSILVRLGWPLAGLAIFVSLAYSVEDVVSLVLAYAFLIAVPINSYYQVRSMLKKSLPEKRRTRGGIAMLRALGTTVCILLFIAVLVPFIALGACLIMMEM